MTALIEIIVLMMLALGGLTAWLAAKLIRFVHPE